MRFETKRKSARKAKEENKMTTVANLAKRAVHDKFESQIKTAEAKLETLKAKAGAAKANVELKAITELLPKKQMIQDKLGELKESSGDRWEQVRGELESQVAEFEKSVKALEPRVKAKSN
jgi:hypothetical protein